MNTNAIYRLNCSICEDEYLHTQVAVLPCCHTVFLCGFCLFTSQYFQCFGCGTEWDKNSLKTIGVKVQMRIMQSNPKHNRNKSDTGPCIMNKLSGNHLVVNRSHNPQMHQGTEYGSNEIYEDFRQFFPQNGANLLNKKPKEIEKHNFFKKSLENQPKPQQFSANSNTYYQDEINENFFQVPLQNPNMLTSVVQRGLPFNTSSNFFQNPSPNGSLINNNDLLNFSNLNLMASAPEKLIQAKGNYNHANSNPNPNNISFSLPNKANNNNNYTENYKTTSHSRYVNLMNEATFLQQTEEVADNNFQNQNINQNPNQPQIQNPNQAQNIYQNQNLNQSQIHNLNQNEISDMDIEMPNINDLQIKSDGVEYHIHNYLYGDGDFNNNINCSVSPPNFSFSTAYQTSRVPNNFFAQNEDIQRNSLKFGVSAQFPDNRNNVRRSLSSLRNTKSSFESNQLTPKATKKAHDDVERLENFTTKKKQFNSNSFMMRNGFVSDPSNDNL